MFQFRQVLVRMRQGDTDRQIARSRLMGRRKATEFRSAATRNGWLDPASPLPEDEQLHTVMGQPRRPSSTISSVEPYRVQVARWFDQGVGGVAIHAALCRQHGYTGSYSSVHRMLKAMGKTQPPDVTVHLRFAPAEAAQVDFGAGPFLHDPATGTQRRTWAFVMTLCYSRHQYVEFVFDQTVATWLGCHRRAFEWFSAVPARIIIDNPKCAITRACVYDPVVQRAYAEAAEGYSFKIDACPPADPQKKGIVESGVKYVKRNFLPIRQFRDMIDLNAQARAWVMEEAGLRIHGTTREQPLTRFELERPLMIPLPAIAPDLGVWTKVKLHRDCHAQFDYSYYSAPFTLVGQSLWLRATDVSVSIYRDFKLVATHMRARKPGTWRTVQEHLPPEAQAFFTHDRHWCLTQAERVGPACTEFIATLLGDKILERLRGAQGVLGFADSFGAERLEAACRRALDHDSIHYRTVKTILQGNFDRLPPAQERQHDLYAVDARFIRSAKSLFTPAPADAERPPGGSSTTAAPKLKLIRN